MTGFLILAAVLVAGALLLVVPPMLGVGARARALTLRQRQAETVLLVLREQLAELENERAAGRMDTATYDRAREELEARALEEGRAAEDGTDTRPSKIPALIVGLLVPLIAVGFYLSLGEPDGLDPEIVAGGRGHQITQEQMAGLVEQLVDRLDADPSDPTGWLMLVRSYAMLGDVQGAARAWARIGDKAPADAGILADWADVLVAAQSGDFSGEPERLIRRALELEPGNFKALALAGSAAFERGDFPTAVARWELILEQIPPSEQVYGSVLASVNEARAKAGMPPLASAAGSSAGAADAPASAVASEAGAGLEVSGTVGIAPELRDDIKPDETVFVFVRPAQGGAPIAALRFVAGDLPASFSFAGAPRMTDAPVPAELVVAARLSRQGDATARSGDLEGFSATVTPSDSGVSVVIDSVRP